MASVIHLCNLLCRTIHDPTARLVQHDVQPIPKKLFESLFRYQLNLGSSAEYHATNTPPLASNRKEVAYGSSEVGNIPIKYLNTFSKHLSKLYGER